MLDAHLDESKENLGAYSEVHGERFDQALKILRADIKDNITKT